MRWKLTGLGSKSSSHVHAEQGSAHTAQQCTQSPKEVSPSETAKRSLGSAARGNVPSGGSVGVMAQPYPTPTPFAFARWLQF